MQGVCSQTNTKNMQIVFKVTHYHTLYCLLTFFISVLQLVNVAPEIRAMTVYHIICLLVEIFRSV